MTTIGEIFDIPDRADQRDFVLRLAAGHSTQGLLHRLRSF